MSDSSVERLQVQNNRYSLEKTSCTSHTKLPPPLSLYVVIAFRANINFFFPPSCDKWYTMLVEDERLQFCGKDSKKHECSPSFLHPWLLGAVSHGHNGYGLLSVCCS